MTDNAEILSTQPDASGSIDVKPVEQPNAETSKPTQEEIFKKAFNKNDSKKQTNNAARGDNKNKPEDKKPGDDKEAAGGDSSKDAIAPGDAPKKKTAQDRIQETIRDKKKAQADLEAKSKEVEKLQAELAKYQHTPDQYKNPKDFYREAVIEDKLKENLRNLQTDLQSYHRNHANPDVFKTNYDYYTPIIQRSDPWTISQISKFPEKWAMLDEFYQAMTDGVFSVKEWIEAPAPMKMQKISDLRKLVKEKNKPAEVHVKQVADSVLPPDQTNHNPNNKPSAEAVFQRVFRQGWKKK